MLGWERSAEVTGTSIVTAGVSKVRLALVAYRDYGDTPVFQIVQFTEDLQSFRADVGALRVLQDRCQRESY